LNFNEKTLHHITMPSLVQFLVCLVLVFTIFLSWSFRYYYLFFYKKKGSFLEHRTKDYFVFHFTDFGLCTWIHLFIHRENQKSRDTKMRDMFSWKLIELPLLAWKCPTKYVSVNLKGVIRLLQFEGSIYTSQSWCLC
jgi:hypothetical protein